MRNRIIAGNWKMNKTFEEAGELIAEITEYILENNPGNTSVVICPPYLYLELAADHAYDTPLFVGAQNLSQFRQGAFTGEISAGMLSAMGIDFCIIGHSERRKYFGETGEMLSMKVDRALESDMTPIFCCGETLPEREAGSHFKVVKQQLAEGLFHLKPENFGTLVIAYEPVWAIGTGVNATPDQAQEMHAFIRSVISEQYGQDIAGQKIILYGGSCNAANASSLFSQPDVDGGLIGGASLTAGEFISIIGQSAR